MEEVTYQLAEGLYEDQTHGSEAMGEGKGMTPGARKT